ncbi:MAG: class I SAM-dependent methyltransferase [Planctomycetes bacterium]|nr:class I SAM-dependent methyltransferase [Planctomycetota bacterium]
MAHWNSIAERKLSKLTGKLRKARVDAFVNRLQLGPHDVVLDLGSEDGSYLASHYPYPGNIVLADVREEPMKRGVERYGLKDYILLSVDGEIPAENGQFDAVWCNSCIEHVTVPRERLPHLSSRSFRAEADAHQRRFAEEICRVSKSYFVQTPYLHFPVEAHSWLPGIQYVPLGGRLVFSRYCRTFWFKQWTPDFLLYGMQRFKAHFPDASEVRIEWAFGLPKSLIAVRRHGEGVLGRVASEEQRRKTALG